MKSGFVEVKQKAPILHTQESSIVLKYKDFSLDLGLGYDRQSLTDLLKILRAL